MKKMIQIFAHGGIVLSVVFMTFNVLDKYNPMLGFLTNRPSTVLLWVFCACSLINGIVLVCQRKR